MGWQHIEGSRLRDAGERDDFRAVLLEQRLRAAVRHNSPWMTDDSQVEQAVARLRSAARHVTAGSLAQANTPPRCCCTAFFRPDPTRRTSGRGSSTGRTRRWKEAGRRSLPGTITWSSTSCGCTTPTAGRPFSTSSSSSTAFRSSWWSASRPIARPRRPGHPRPACQHRAAPRRRHPAGYGRPARHTAPVRARPAARAADGTHAALGTFSSSEEHYALWRGVTPDYADPAVRGDEGTDALRREPRGWELLGRCWGGHCPSADNSKRSWTNSGDVSGWEIFRPDPGPHLSCATHVPVVQARFTGRSWT